MTLYEKMVNAIKHIITNICIVSKAEENDGQDKSKRIYTFHRRRGSNRSRRRQGSRPLCTRFLRAGPCYAPEITRFHKNNVGEIGFTQESYDNCYNIVMDYNRLRKTRTRLNIEIYSRNNALTLTSGGSFELSSAPSQGADEQLAMRHKFTKLSLPPLMKGTDNNTGMLELW